MIDTVFYTARAWDLPDGGEEVRDALERGRELLMRTGLAVPPLTAWDDLRHYLDDLYTERETIGGGEAVVHVVEAAEVLGENSPMAAVVPALAAVAAWEGPSRDMLLKSSEGARNWGWHALVWPLGRILLRADATWAARALTTVALGIVSMAYERIPIGFPMWHIDAALAGLREVDRAVAARHAEARTELALALRRACRESQRARLAVASMWWTVGSPWHASALAAGRLTPTLKQLRGLLSTLLRSSSSDPLLGAVGAELCGLGQDGVWPPECLDRRLRVWQRTEAYERVEGPFEHTGISPIQEFPRCLSAYLRGQVTERDRMAIGRITSRVESFDPGSAIRFRALELLMGGDQEDHEMAWRELSNFAARAIEDASWTATENAYDRSVDIPWHYMEGEPGERLAQLDRHRIAALDYHLTARGASYPSGEANEQRLLEETRGLRLVAQLPRLPAFMTRASAEVSPEDFSRGGEGSIFFRGAWSDTDAAAKGLIELRERLRPLPAGRASSMDHDLQSFAAALGDQGGEPDDILAAVAGRAQELGEAQLPPWVDLAAQLVLGLTQLGLAPEADVRELGRDAVPLAYTAARLGFNARRAECEAFQVQEANRHVTQLLEEAHALNPDESWFELISRLPAGMVTNADRNPSASEVAQVLAPEGIGHRERRRLAELVVRSILASERGRPWELGSVRSETLVECWRLGYYLSACHASLPATAQAELA